MTTDWKQNKLFLRPNIIYLYSSFWTTRKINMYIKQYFHILDHQINMYLSVSLFIYLSIYLPIYLSISLSLLLFGDGQPSLYFINHQIFLTLVDGQPSYCIFWTTRKYYIYLSSHLCIYLSIFIYFYLYPSMYLSIYLYIYIYILSICRSIYRYIYWSINLYLYLLTV